MTHTRSGWQLAAHIRKTLKGPGSAAQVRKARVNEPSVRLTNVVAFCFTQHANSSFHITHTAT